VTVVVVALMAKVVEKMALKGEKGCLWEKGGEAGAEEQEKEGEGFCNLPSTWSGDRGERMWV
jgi:hypothetical protein